jgi:cytoskeletal protein RodZ
MVTSVGELLRSERQKQRLSLSDVEKYTRIRKKNLVAVEKGDWKDFSSRTYIQGIIRTYSAFLKLDEEKMLAYFRREYERHENLKFKQRTTAKQFTPLTKKVARYVVVAMVLLFSLYFGYQLQLFLVPPKLEILEPTKTEFRREDKITIKGKVDKDTTVHINGTQVFPNEQYIFSYNLALAETFNKATIVATGANGKKTTIERIYKRSK